MSNSQISLKLNRSILFNGHNPADFIFWRKSMVLLLRSHKIFNEVLLPRPAGMANNDPNPLYRPRNFVSKDEDNTKATLVILQALDQAIAQSFDKQADEAFSLWAAVNERFSRDTESTKASLVQALEMERLKEDENINEYVGRLQNHFSRLSSLDSDVSDQRQKYYFTAGLLPEYKAVVDTLRISAPGASLSVWIRHVQDKYEDIAKDKEKQKIAEAARLVANNNISEEKAAYVQSDSNNSNGGNGRGGYRAGYIRHGSGYRGRGRYQPYNSGAQQNASTGYRGRGRGGYYNARYMARGGRNNSYPANRYSNSGNRYRGNYHNNNNSNNLNNSSDFSADIRSNTCFYCHKPGHRAATCWHDPRNSNSNSNSSSNSSSNNYNNNPGS